MALISTTQDLFPRITRLQKQYSIRCCRIRKSSTIGCWILDNQLPLIAYRSVQCSMYKEMMKKHAIKDKGIALGYNKLEAAYRHDTSKTGSFITRIMALKVFTQRIRWNNRKLYLQLGKSVLSVKWQPLSMQDKSVKLHYLVILIQFILSCTLLSNPSASATDALKTCTCLLKECRVELARCIADPACAANVACINACNNRPDEIECQIKCGDLFENTVVDQFNECAVSRKKCVSRKSDEGTYPIPEPAALVKNFNLSDFVGKWYISSGLNPSFDTFDCQVHEFNVSEGRLNVNLTWRISTPDGGFFTRSTMQKFIQDASNPGILYNHDNEYLHYQDDWYILSSKIENTADDYVFVYYRGSNDAWDGYGGAVVYTRSRFVPSTIVPELENAARKVGLDFSRFRKTDNTCGPEPPLLARIEKKVIEGEQAIAKEVEEIEETVEETVEKVENTEMNLLERLGKGFKELRKDEENFLKGLNEEEKELLGSLKMEAEQVEKLFGKSLPLRKLR